MSTLFLDNNQIAKAKVESTFPTRVCWKAIRCITRCIVRCPIYIDILWMIRYIPNNEDAHLLDLTALFPDKNNLLWAENKANKSIVSQKLLPVHTSTRGLQKALY